MKIKSESFVIPAGKKVVVEKLPTRITPFYKSEKEYKNLLQESRDELMEKQRLLYASGEYALLLVFQAMDAAGKDSAIKHVMSGVDPHGCEVHSFKVPSEEESKHDFLWRTNEHLPPRGKIGIFNRSYYEEVIVVKVHPEFLSKQNLPPEFRESKHIWKNRYQSIVDKENHLHLNGTRVVKFFLHLSKEEQRKRLLSRLEDPEKNWKFSKDDLAERALWGDYMQAYGQCLSATSTKNAPWYAIPADDKMNARLIVSRVILDTLASMKMHYPIIGKEKVKELKEIHTQLEA